MTAWANEGGPGYPAGMSTESGMVLVPRDYLEVVVAKLESEFPTTAKHLRVMLAAAPAPPPTPAVDAPQNLEFPAELNDDLREILGRPCFACSGIAEILRHSGISIAPKAESEQATVLHWMLLRYLKHRANWAKEVRIELQALAQLPPSTEPPK